MAIIDLRSLEGDQVVIHFGGDFASVDAYTLANSLIAFADTAAAVNAVINPDQTIEIRVEAVGPGSFRALIRKVQKGAGGFFSRGAEQLFWGIVAALIVQRLLSGDPTTTVRVTPDGVVVESGGNTTIISKEVFEEAERAKGSEKVQKCLDRTFETLQRDEAIKSFGLTPRMDDPKPVIEIPREDFPKLTEQPSILESEQRRERRENVRVVILKAWFKPGTRKWSFEWNGYPITAPIKDPEFWSRLEKREYLIGAGDALDVILTFEESFVEEFGLYVADPNTYVVEKVIRPVPRTLQPPLLADD